MTRAAQRRCLMVIELNHRFAVSGGVLADKASASAKAFFKSHAFGKIRSRLFKRYFDSNSVYQQASQTNEIITEMSFIAIEILNTKIRDTY